MTYAFISYSHGDGGYVDRLTKCLEDAGLYVWTDGGIDYGAQWSDVIAKQIDGCAAFVPVMSPRSRGSTWVRREILYAQQRNRPILPLLLEGDRFIELIDIQDELVSGGLLPGSRWIDRVRTLVTAGPSSEAYPNYENPYGSGAIIGRMTPHELWRYALDGWSPDARAHGRMVSLEMGEATVTADSAEWVDRIRAIVPNIIARFDYVLGAGVVTKIKVIG
jgi:hypothetical protein